MISFDTAAVFIARGAYPSRHRSSPFSEVMGLDDSDLVPESKCGRKSPNRDVRDNYGKTEPKGRHRI